MSHYAGPNTTNEMKLPPYEQYPSISDAKIVLRQIQSFDIHDIIEISFYNGVRAATLEQAIEMQAKIDMDYRNGSSIHWGIADPLTDKLSVPADIIAGWTKVKVNWAAFYCLNTADGVI
ncbi:hypothetical protein [Kaistella soli]|uniref:hypothetical protein n=1 Tax=Kaistella soli TaxID=2849654 RepID=UPI001FE83734|nr:hypothetical protein [Kaistella soli]